jgi:pyrroloquinoline quinone biosynthesis protein B
LPLDGIFLTHAHIGHYTGLVFLGKESMAARGVAVFGTRSMRTFLSSNGPWKRLVADGNIDLKPLASGRRIELDAGLSIEPLRVPHRDEESDAVGFIVRGPGGSLLYIPDIDSWDRWERDIESLVRSVDVALLDGTFFSAEELPGRPMEEIPHPLIRKSMARLEPAVRSGARVIFIHLNHTNPALRPGSAERLEVESRGFEIAEDGMELPL